MNIEQYLSMLEEKGITLSSRQLEQFEIYFETLVEWNEKMNLTAITEDIVTELDSKLKDVGFSDSAIKNAKENLEITLGKLKIFSEGRKNIISDFIAIPSHYTNDYEKIVKELSEAFEEINNLVKDIEQSLESYIKSSPAFITEFLSPEGIMTKKRSIDTQISDNRNKIKVSFLRSRRLG